MTENSPQSILAVELVDILGLFFWVAILTGAILHAVYARVPRKWIIEHLYEASLLMVCLVSLSGVIGFISSGQIAAIGSAIAMGLWCTVGFLMWTTTRWIRKQAKRDNDRHGDTEKDIPGSKLD